MSLGRWIPLVLGAAALAVACSSTPPPEPIPEPVAAPKPPPPEPEKKKECKALDEKCEAEDDTKAKIAGSDLALKPAKGWTYAQGEAALIAQSADDGAAIAVAEVETGTDAKQEPAKRDEALEALAQQINVTLPKKKVNWKKPAEEKTVGDLKISLWQLDEAARGEKKGPILIFAAPRTEGKLVLGIGFVPGDDSSGADAAILESIESISGN